MEFSEPWERRIQTNAAACFDVSLSLSVNVSAGGACGLERGGFLAEVFVADQRKKCAGSGKGEGIFPGPLSKDPNPAMHRTHVQATAYSVSVTKIIELIKDSSSSSLRWLTRAKG